MLKNILFLLIKFEVLFEFLRDSFWNILIKKAMGSCGKNVMLKPTTSVFKGIENFHFGNNVRISRYAIIYSTRAKIIIGEKVDIAPKLNIITGNHRIDIIGKFMFDVTDSEKLPENDKDVIIGDEVWIGVNVTLLSGAIIGRGSVVSSGAVVTKIFPPYAIIAGIPAKILKYRFTIDEIIAHEKTLYEPSKRFTKNQLISFR